MLGKIKKAALEVKEWFTKPNKTVKDHVLLIVLVFLAHFLWTGWVIDMFMWLFHPEREQWIKTLIFGCILAPLWEELLYRVAPIQAAKAINKKLIWPTVLGVSIIFGLGHIAITGNAYFHILVQGVAGLSLSYVYIKSGYRYMVVVASHALWNAYAFFGNLLF